MSRGTRRKNRRQREAKRHWARARVSRPVLGFASALLCVSSCLKELSIGEFRPGAAGGAGGNELGGAEAAGGSIIITGGGAGLPSAGAAGNTGCVVTPCLGKVFQCGDCLDNDHDDVVDSKDDLCFGPCDDTEDSFYGGIPGQNNQVCTQDCYFDRDAGAGNDGCYYSQTCDPLSLPTDYPPSGDSRCAFDPNVSIPGTTQSCADVAQAQQAACLDYCLPLTPNGCDCFGCCELPTGSGKYVWLGSTVDKVGSCSYDNVDDESACHPCTPVPSCFNDCDTCEVCVGRSELDPACADETQHCSAGSKPCGLTGQADCASGYFCLTGCCTAAPK